MAEGELSLADPAATEAVGAWLGTRLRGGDVVTLSGPLGSGKTSIARGVLRGAGLEGEAPSPSFALLIAYAPPDTRLPIAHADLYRLTDPSEGAELGLADAAADGALLIEWPERLGARWPGALVLCLAETDEGGRCLTWRAPAGWAGRWPPPQ